MPATPSFSRPVIKSKPYVRHPGIPWIIMPHPVVRNRVHLAPPPQVVPPRFEMLYPQEVEHCDHLSGMNNFVVSCIDVKLGGLLEDQTSDSDSTFSESPFKQSIGSPTSQFAPVQYKYWKRRQSDGSFVDGKDSPSDSQFSREDLAKQENFKYRWISSAQPLDPKVKVEEITEGEVEGGQGDAKVNQGSLGQEEDDEVSIKVEEDEEDEVVVKQDTFEED